MDADLRMDLEYLHEQCLMAPTDFSVRYIILCDTFYDCGLLSYRHLAEGVKSGTDGRIFSRLKKKRVVRPQICRMTCRTIWPHGLSARLVRSLNHRKYLVVALDSCPGDLI